MDSSLEELFPELEGFVSFCLFSHSSLVNVSDFVSEITLLPSESVTVSPEASVSYVVILTVTLPSLSVSVSVSDSSGNVISSVEFLFLSASAAEDASLLVEDFLLHPIVNEARAIVTINIAAINLNFKLLFFIIIFLSILAISTVLIG